MSLFKHCYYSPIYVIILNTLVLRTHTAKSIIQSSGLFYAYGFFGYICMKFPTLFSPCALIAKSIFIVTLSIIYALNAYANPHQNLVSIDQIYTLSITESEPNAEVSSKQITLKGAGAIFAIELEKNTSLLEKFKLPASNNQTLFKGKITGNSDSWVRLSEVEGVYSGTIYDGTELYIIDRNDQLNQLMSASQSLQFEQRSPSTQVMYKASDITNNGFCGIEGHNHGTSAFDYSEFVEELNLPHDSEATRQIEVALVADTEYADDYGDDTQQQMLSIMNNVDGIFSEQVNVHLSIVSSEVLTNNGSLTTLQPEPLVFAFRDYVFNEIGNPGVTHLFTGKNLQDNVLGIAFVSELCTSYGVGLSQNFGSSTFFVVAHELGHIFGAPHDNQDGSVCASTSSNFLMNPSINNQDQFSACSLAQIDSHINQTNADTGGACIINVGPVAPTIVSTGNPNATVGFPYTYDADNSLEVTGDTPLTFTLDIAPLGMGIDNSGTISWIPNAEQLGTQAVQITVSNDSGSDTQNFDITVFEPIDPSLNIVDFNLLEFTPYGEIQDQPSQGNIAVEDGGATLAITGNRWQKTNFSYLVTPSTILKFDFKATVEADIHAIGLDDNPTVSPFKAFNLFGTEAWGIEDFQYDGSGTFQSFTIPVGQYYTGEMEYLFFVLDHDIENPDGNGFFKNIQVFEGDLSLNITFIDTLDGDIVPADELFSIEAVASETANLPIDTVEFSADQELWILATNIDGTFRLDDFGPVAEGPGELYARINSSIIQAIPYTAAIREPDEPIGYYFLNPKWVGSEVNIYALADNTILDINGSQQTLNEGELLTHTITAQGEFVSANKNFSVGTEENGLDMPVPTSFMGTEFLVPHVRFGHIYQLLSPQHDTQVQVSIGTEQTNLSLLAGQVLSFEAGDTNNLAAVFETEHPILLTHSSDKNGDAYPVPAAVNEVFGVRSSKAFIAALQNDTSITVYSNTGANQSLTLNSGEMAAINISSSSSEGTGSAMYVNSNKPISAIQHADSDGSETSTFLSAHYFSKSFILPTSAQYVSILCGDALTELTLTSPDGEVLDSAECTAASPAPGKAYFGSTADGINIERGSKVEASSPIFLYYEDASSNGERNLLGADLQSDILDLTYFNNNGLDQLNSEQDFIAIALVNAGNTLEIQTIEFSINQEDWFNSNFIDGEYQFNFGRLEAGNYTLYARVNADYIQSISISISSPPIESANGYYFLNPNWVDTEVNIYALSDMTTLRIDGLPINLNKGDLATHVVSTQGQYIYADKPFSIGTETTGFDLPVPDNFLGTRFVIPHVRFSHHYYLLSPELDTQVQIEIGGEVTTVQLLSGQVFYFNGGEQNDIAALISSESPILVTHTANQNGDNFPVPPSSTSVSGFRSAKAYVGAQADNTEITLFSNFGATRTIELNAGESSVINFSSSASDGRGSSYYLTSNNPISAIQLADSDGSESTAFWGPEHFALHFILPVPTQYVAAMCIGASATITFTDASNSVSEEVLCISEGNTPGKVYFGSPIDGENIAKGSTIDSDEPIFLIYESALTDEERNLLGSSE